MKTATRLVAAAAATTAVITVTLPWIGTNETALVACPPPTEGRVAEIQLRTEGGATVQPCPDGTPDGTVCFHAAAWFRCVNVGADEEAASERMVIFVPEPTETAMLIAGAVLVAVLAGTRRRSRVRTRRGP